MSFSGLWHALKAAPGLVEGLIAAGDVLAEGRSPLLAADVFVAKSGLGAAEAAELRALVVQGVSGLAMVVGTAAVVVAHEPQVRVALEKVLDWVLDAGYWASRQEFTLKGWLDPSS